jgi:hypothetical protein
VPSSKQIADFVADHPEPLVRVPEGLRTDYDNGKLAVLKPPLEMTVDENISFEAIGFASDSNQALFMLRQHILDLPAVHEREAFYYADDIWPPVMGKSFEPLIGPTAQLMP